MHADADNIVGIEAYTDFTDPALNGYQVLLRDADRFLAAHLQHRRYRRMRSTHATVAAPVVAYTNGLRMDRRKFEDMVGHYLGADAR